MKNFDLNDVYIVNPAYKFRNDIKRVLLTNNNSLYFDSLNLNKSNEYTSNFTTVVHPLTAYIFSFFDGGKKITQIIEELIKELDLPFEEIKSTILPFINNSEEVVYRMSDQHLASIPKNFLIKQQNFPIRNLLEGIDVDNMLIDLDLNAVRSYIPNEITYMLTNRCYTDCVYCFADTNTKVYKELPFEKIKELISEAHTLGCRDFLISGGEFFLYKNWVELFNVLIEHEFEPFISTKYPIDEKIIIKLKELKVTKLQISLDTINPDEIVKMINADKLYLERIKKSLNLLEKYQINFRVKSVITKYNDNIDSIQRLIEYLLSFKSLTQLDLAPGESSLWKPLIYSTTKEKLKKIETYVNIVKYNDLRVNLQGYAQPVENLSFEDKMNRHNNRARCSGNLNAFFILPDGKVTICEQMYWHPFFILGDLTQQSIMEVWNSEKSLSLWNISQDEIQEASACKTCKIFEECRRGKGSCWKMAVAAYGHENYDFPYPECPFAPPVTRSFYIH